MVKIVKIISMTEGIINSITIIFFFFLPFERIPSWEVFGFTIKISYLLALVLIFASAYKYKSFAQSRTKSDLSLLLFWLYSALTIIQTKDLKHSIMILFMWAFVFLLYYILARLITADSRKKIENLILISTAVVCLFGLYQFIADSLDLPTHLSGLRLRYTKEILGFSRIQSVALEPLYFANFLFVPLYLAFDRYLKNAKLLNIYLPLIILVLINLILTVSRGAYLGFAVTFIIYIAFLLSRGQYLKKIFIFALSVLAAFLLSYVLVDFSSRSNPETFTNHIINDNNSVSVKGRTDGYVQSIQKFIEKPVFGIGLGNSSVLDEPIQDKDELFKYGSINNEYLEILSETGIVGFSFFALFILFYIKEAMKAYKKSAPTTQLTQIAIALGLIAIAIQYVFFSTLYIIYIWSFLALLKSYQSETKTND